MTKKWKVHKIILSIGLTFRTQNPFYIKMKKSIFEKERNSANDSFALINSKRGRQGEVASVHPLVRSYSFRGAVQIVGKFHHIFCSLKINSRMSQQPGADWGGGGLAPTPPRNPHFWSGIATVTTCTVGLRTTRKTPIIRFRTIAKFMTVDILCRAPICSIITTKGDCHSNQGLTVSNQLSLATMS